MSAGRENVNDFTNMPKSALKMLPFVPLCGIMLIDEDVHIFIDMHTQGASVGIVFGLDYGKY